MAPSILPLRAISERDRRGARVTRALPAYPSNLGVRSPLPLVGLLRLL